MKNRNYFFLFGFLLSATLVLTFCQKDNMIESVDDINVTLANLGNLKSSEDKCSYGPDSLLKILTKHSWTYGEAYHDDPDVQKELESVLWGLEFTFNPDGTYHYAVPLLGRDSTGTWQVVDRFFIVFNKGTEREHYISVLTLVPYYLKYLYIDPDYGRCVLGLYTKFPI